MLLQNKMSLRNTFYFENVPHCSFMKINKTILFTLCIVMVVLLFSLTASADTEFSVLETGFKITIEEPVIGDNYQLWLGKVNITEDDLENINDAYDFMSKVEYVDFMTVTNTNPITFTVDLSYTTAYGPYTIRFIRSGSEDDIENCYYTYKHVDPTLSDRAINAFMSVQTNSEFSEKLAEFSTVPNDFFLEDDLGIFANSEINSEIGANFALLREIKYKDGNKFKTGKEIIDCAGAAYALTALLGDDVEVAENRISEYGSFMSEYFPVNSKTKETMKFIAGAKAHITDSESLGDILTIAKMHGETAGENAFSIFDILKSEINSVDDFEKIINWSVALGKLMNATRAEIEQTISDNDILFGVNTSADAHYGITLAQIAQRFDTSKGHILYGAEVFSSYYDELAKAIAEEEEKKKEKSESKYSGNNGNGGGTRNITAYVENTDKSKVNTEEVSVANNDIELPFVDVKNFEWAHKYIKTLYSKGVVEGVNTDRFEPERAITRGEFVKMLVVAFNIKGNNEVIFSFDDVTVDMWSYPYIETAYRSGIVNGMNKNYFGALETITRQDAAVMLARVIGADSESKAKFTDSGNISEYAMPAVVSLSERGIVAGNNDGSFNPGGVTTRVQATAMIARALEGGIVK